MITVLTAPGLGGSGPLHWQSVWEREYPGFRRIEQDDWEQPRRDDWVRRIEQEVQAAGEGVVIAAHSLACLAMAHWGASGRSRIRGALLVAPPDPESPHFPAETNGFLPVPLAPLPFPSIVVGSRNDEYITIERCAELARRWGSRFVDIGEKGHINSASNLGLWPEGKALLDELTM